MTEVMGSLWIVLPGVGICSFIITYINSDRILAWLREQSFGNREYVIKKLDLMFVEINKKRITTAMIMISYGVGSLAFIVCWPHVVVGLVLGTLFTVMGWKLPKVLVNWYSNRRCGEFVDQMVDGLTLMSNGLKSGLSIPQSMKIVADHMPNPISQEFELMLSQSALGVSIEEVYNDLAKRIPYPDVQMFVIAVNILKDTGGNIAETFDTIVRTVRERIKVEKKIAAVTAQGVMQGTIISAMPFFLLIMLYFMDPAFIAPLFNKPLGWVMLGVMLILQIIGGLMIRKIVKIKV